MQSIIFSREVMILLATIAAVLVTAGTVLRVRSKEIRGRTASSLIYAGYAFFFLSIALFLTAR